jgi:hypothetical protein
LIKFGQSFTEFGQSFTEFGQSFTEFGQSFTEFGQSLIEFGQSLIEFGQSFTEFGQSLIEFGVPKSRTKLDRLVLKKANTPRVRARQCRAPTMKPVQFCLVLVQGQSLIEFGEPPRIYIKPFDIFVVNN